MKTMQNRKSMCGRIVALVADAGTFTSAVPDPTTFDLTTAQADATDGTYRGNWLWQMCNLLPSCV